MNTQQSRPSKLILALLIGIPVLCGLAVLGLAIASASRSNPAIRPAPLATLTHPAPVATQRPVQLPAATQPAIFTPIPPSPIPAATQSPTRPVTLQAATRSPATTAPTWTPWPTSTTGSTSSWATECPCTQGNVLNCPDFSSQAQAQACYLKCGGIGHDIHGLDRDKDGTACEDTTYR